MWMVKRNSTILSIFLKRQTNNGPRQTTEESVSSSENKAAWVF